MALGNNLQYLLVEGVWGISGEVRRDTPAAGGFGFRPKEFGPVQISFGPVTSYVFESTWTLHVVLRAPPPLFTDLDIDSGPKFAGFMP